MYSKSCFFLYSPRRAHHNTSPPRHQSSLHFHAPARPFLTITAAGDRCSLPALLLVALSWTLTRFRMAEEEEEEGEQAPPHRPCRRSMEIGWPRNVRHIAHVTFDRFHGFLGLPVEFEPEVPRRAPSASANVFGVSTESMQCSYDSSGNSVPTILLLMQRRLYEQGGLQAEGIFRISACNSEEEYVRDQLNNGIVPDDIDVNCLASLIKAWFRELPTGVLDPLNPEQVMQCQSEDDFAELARLLPPTEAALLDWAINLMADVVQEEQQNKMNARNVAMVFAPGMTQMADPVIALMYVVQVMHFLKTLILKKLKDRQELALEDASMAQPDPSDENGHQSPQLHVQACNEDPIHFPEENSTTDIVASVSQTGDNALSEDATGGSSEEDLCDIPTRSDSPRPESANNATGTLDVNSHRTRRGRSTSIHHKKKTGKSSRHTVRSTLLAEKSRGASVLSRINSKLEGAEAWR